jgi:hypothetical protein
MRSTFRLVHQKSLTKGFAFHVGSAQKRCGVFHSTSLGTLRDTASLSLSVFQMPRMSSSRLLLPSPTTSSEIGRGDEQTLQKSDTREGSTWQAARAHTPVSAVRAQSQATACLGHFQVLSSPPPLRGLPTFPSFALSCRSRGLDIVTSFAPADSCPPLLVRHRGAY